MNELSRRVLFSIDAVLKLPEDEGSCHYWTLCENNRYAKRQSNGQKYWIPIWRYVLVKILIFKYFYLFIFI